jgi:hypothetical protein
VFRRLFLPARFQFEHAKRVSRGQLLQRGSQRADPVPRIDLLSRRSVRLVAVHAGHLLRHRRPQRAHCKLLGVLLLRHRLDDAHAAPVFGGHVLSRGHLFRPVVPDRCLLPGAEECTYCMYARFILRLARPVGRVGSVFCGILLSCWLCVGHASDLHGRLVVWHLWAFRRRWYMLEWHLLSCWQHGRDQVHRVGLLSVERYGQLYAVHAGVILQHDGFVGRVGRMYGRILL